MPTFSDALSSLDWGMQLQVFAMTFLVVFLKGFQYKNVIGNHTRAVAITSYAMAVCDVLYISSVAKSGWSSCFAAGTGAALAMVASMQAHDFLLKRKGRRNEVEKVCEEVA